MSRATTETEDRASGATFRRILAEVRRAERNRAKAEEQDAESPRFAANPLAGASFSFDGGPMATGGESHWDAALAFIEEQDEPAANDPSQRPPADRAESILEELGLRENMCYDELNRLRRLYMWRNHPDRHGEDQRESATRRVAIGNMLVDRAQARLSGAGRP